ncbi:hypothetical protein KF840_04565 [bacterium]|nr:hypothetical protein [bacterium]
MAVSARGEHGFALVVGLVDGILTALVLAAGKVVASHAAVDAGDVIRVAVVASISAAFTFFVAQYATFRNRLVEAAKHLTLGSRGPLVRTQLGRAVLVESIIGSLVSGSCSFMGAVFPLLVAMALPGASWISLGGPIAALGVLGGFLGRSAEGNVLTWAMGLMSVGVLLAFVGVQVRIM